MKDYLKIATLFYGDSRSLMTALPEPQNKRMAVTALDWYASLAPRAARPFLRRIFLALIDPRVVAACDLPSSSRADHMFANLVMRCLGRRDPVPGAAPDLLEPLVAQVYPNGWELGPQQRKADAAPPAAGHL